MKIKGSRKILIAVIMEAIVVFSAIGYFGYKAYEAYKIQKVAEEKQLRDMIPFLKGLKIHIEKQWNPGTG